MVETSVAHVHKAPPKADQIKMVTGALHCSRQFCSQTRSRQENALRLPSSRQSISQRRRGQLQTCNLFGGKKDGEGGGNPFANMGNLMENMKKAQQLVQVEAARVQEELAATDFEGYCEDETVRVVMSGNQEPRSVDFTEEALEQGSEKLAELTYAAMKDAHTKSVQGMKSRMGELASRLGIPAGSKPLGM